jgi:alkylation response protein AidB-like acyl-CoA dehydrogenase
MDLGLSEFQQKMKETARDFLERECPKSLIRDLDESGSGHSPEVWGKIADLGWLGVALPERFGGLEGGLIDLAVILQEMGYAAFPSPFAATTVWGAITIEDAGSEAQQRRLLPGVADGSTILTMALAEQASDWSADDIALSIVPNGDGFVLNGEKRFVPYAQTADHILVAGRQPGTSGESGVTLAIVAAGSDGLTLQRLLTTGGQRQYAVSFANVRVPGDAIIGRPGEAWPTVHRAIQRATALQCAHAVGASERALAMTVEHAQTRTQFGQPLGKFQAVQHFCSDMAMLTEGARLITYEAIWRLSEGLPAAKEIAMAKAFTNGATRQTSWLAQQIHGGIGIMREYDLHFYFREIKAAEQTLGITRDALAAVADAMELPA